MRLPEHITVEIACNIIIQLIGQFRSVRQNGFIID